MPCRPVAEELYKKFLAACRAETLRALPYEAFALPDPGQELPRPERTKRASNRSACCSWFNFEPFWELVLYWFRVSMMLAVMDASNASSS